MPIDDVALSEHQQLIGAAFENPWSPDELRAVSSRNVPEQVLGSMAWLLRADAAMTWSRWFLAGVSDPSRYVEDLDLHWGHLYKEVKDSLRADHPDLQEDELRDLARALSDVGWSEIVLLRNSGRVRIARSERERLWAAAGTEPRCWLCGYMFSEYAHNKFLGLDSPNLPGLPLLVDFVRPRGLDLRDLTIEVDHARPVSTGGTSDVSNLRLACGWCNRNKSDALLLYDRPTLSAGSFRHPSLGVVALPQPLWVIRLVASRARCDSPGCEHTLESAELFAAPRRAGGALTPTNMGVFCADHDAWGVTRFVGSGLVPSLRRR